jgi:hypothetical protein
MLRQLDHSILTLIVVAAVNVASASSRDNVTRLVFHMDETVFKLAKSSDTSRYEYLTTKHEG